MGTEFIVGSEDEPQFDIEDEMDTVMVEIGGWPYLLGLAGAEYHWYDAIIAPEHLEAFARGCVVLGEEYGDPRRNWSGEATEHFRAWEVSGTDLRNALLGMAQAARSAMATHTVLTIRSDMGWVEQTWWQAAAGQTSSDPPSRS